MQLEIQAYKQDCNIFYKSVQIVAYSDDIAIISKSVASMKEAFQLLEETSKKVGLLVNEGKPKYMVPANTKNCSKPRAIVVGKYSFERVDRFTYLGTLLTGDII